MSFALKLAQRLPKSLRVEWEDGLCANFTYVWLRDNSEKRPSLLHLDLNARPEIVDYSNGKLSVVWPPFLHSDYSSKFLRDHTKVKILQSVSCPITKKVLTVPWRLQEKPQDVVDYSQMATVEWKECAQEPATLWPHLEKVPSICAVESLNSGGKVHLVDAVSALSLMSHTHPEQFAFLAAAPIEYSSDMFAANHRVATIEDGRIIAAVFNNQLRSPEITVDCLDMLYASLKTFHQICLDTMHTVNVEPGQLLVVDNSQTFIGAPAQHGRHMKLTLYN